MSTKLFSTLFDELMIDVPSLTTDIALMALRNAAIDFCDRSMCWVIDADPMDSVANQGTYQFEPIAGTEVVSISQAWYNGALITTCSVQQLEDLVSVGSTMLTAGVPWHKQVGLPKYVVQERPDEFILCPIPSEGLSQSISMKIAVKPSRTSIGMEGWVIDKYYEALVSGAKSKLFAMQKKPWSSPELASYHGKIFDQGVTKANAFSGYKLPLITSSISPI